MKELDHNAVLQYQQDYPAGTRILLLHMTDEPRPIPDNTKGTVLHVDDKGQIHCCFDDGRVLAIIPQIDRFRKLAEQETGEVQ